LTPAGHSEVKVPESQCRIDAAWLDSATDTTAAPARGLGFEMHRMKSLTRTKLVPRPLGDAVLRAYWHCLERYIGVNHRGSESKRRDKCIKCDTPFAAAQVSLPIGITRVKRVY
jgi:hypothetical protein